MAPIACMASTHDGSLLATTAADKAFKVFDVLSFDMINWVKLEFAPSVCEWIGGGSSRSRALLAVADADSPHIRLFDTSSEAGLIRTVSIHSAPVMAIKFHAARSAMISIDAKGLIEYWSSEGEPKAPPGLSFRFKADTDLYALAKARAVPMSLALSPDGEYFAVFANDFKIRLFRFASGKCLKTFDESYDAMQLLQKEGDDTCTRRPQRPAPPPHHPYAACPCALHAST